MKDTPTKLSPKDFPPDLREISDAPSSLFLRGTLPDGDITYLAVVGSRRYSEYGARVCGDLIAGLAGTPISIVSGLALGIDALAHKAALRAGLHTVGIPGSGLNDNVLYPRTNLGLAHQILESGGALLSEYEPTTKAALWTIPKRNRLIAGIAKAVLILEAEERSGTLITARLATEYNRDVFTVPHSIYSVGGRGCHKLLKDGAALISNSQDILDALGLKNKEAVLAPSFLSSDEKVVYQALEQPLSKDALAASLSIDISKLNMTLSALELKGIIRYELGKISRTSKAII